MMFILLLFFLPSFEADCDTMFAIRTKYHEIHDKNKLEEFIEWVQDIDCEEVQPYLASAIMRKAEFCFWPNGKLKNFNTGKKMLENYISSHPHNLEARYLRIIVQSKVPSVLGYHQDIPSDLEFLQSHIYNSELPEDFQKLMMDNIHNILN